MKISKANWIKRLAESLSPKKSRRRHRRSLRSNRLECLELRQLLAADVAVEVAGESVGDDSIFVVEMDRVTLLGGHAVFTIRITDASTVDVDWGGFNIKVAEEDRGPYLTLNDFEDEWHYEEDFWFTDGTTKYIEVNVNIFLGTTYDNVVLEWYTGGSTGGDWYKVDEGTVTISHFPEYTAQIEDKTLEDQSGVTENVGLASCSCPTDIAVQTTGKVTLLFEVVVDEEMYGGDLLVIDGNFGDKIISQMQYLNRNSSMDTEPTKVQFRFEYDAEEIRSVDGDEFAEYSVTITSTNDHDYSMTGESRTFSGTVYYGSDKTTVSGVPRVEGGDNGAMISNGISGKYYQDDENGGYISAGGEFSELSHTPGGYQLVDRQGNTYTFDADGYATSMTDSRGRVTTYAYITYNDRKLISHIQSPFHYESFSYENGKLVGAHNSDGAWVMLTYAGSLLSSVRQSDPDGDGPLPAPVTTYTYNTQDRLIAKTVNGLTTTYTYDSTGRLASVVSPSGQRVNQVSPQQSASNGGAFAEKIVDSQGVETVYEYDRYRNVTTTTDELGSVTHYMRDEDGLLLRKVLPDPDGDGPFTAPIYEYTYDSRGNRLTETLPDLSIRSWEYHAKWNKPVKYTDANGHITLYEYDSTYELLLSETKVIGEIDDQINLETDDLTTEYAYTPSPALSTDPPQGLVASETAPDGIVTQFEYDEKGRRTKTIYAVGTADEAYTTTTYDPDGNILTRADELGNTTTYTYDALGRQLTVTTPDPDGAGPLSSTVTTYTYNAHGLKATEDVNGRTTTYTYDSKGRLEKVTQEDPDGAGPLTASETSYTYDWNGNLLTTTDPLGNVTTNTYTSRILTSVTQPDPDGAGSQSAPVTSYTHDAMGRVLTTTDALGGVTTYEYDNLGRRISVTLPDPDGAGALEGLISTTVYDAMDRVVSQTDFSGITTTFTYDSEGNKLTETTPLGTTTYTYDELNRLVKVETADPDGAGTLVALVTTYSYMASGQVASVTTAKGTTYYTYDNRRRRTGEIQIDPNESEPAIDFSTVNFSGYAGQDTPGGIAVLEDGATLQITGNHWKRIAFPYEVTENTVIEFDFQSTVEGEVQGIGFDDDNSLSHGNIFKLYGSQTWSNESYDDYDSDAPGVKHYKIAIGEHFTGSFFYLILANDDDANAAAVSIFSNVRVYEDVEPATTTTTYDDAGNVLTETDVLGNVTSYTYDNLNRVVAITSPDPDGTGPQAAPVTSYAYDSYGQLVGMTDPNGGTTTYEYDELGRRTKIIYADPDGVGPQASPEVSYSYDAAGQLASITDELGNVTTYEYDGLGRQIKITLPDPDGAGPDTAPETTYSYDAAGQLLSITDPLGRTTSYTYDAMGRKLTETLPDPDGVGGQAAPVTTYVYNNNGQLASVTDAELQTLIYTYNSAGLLATLTDPRGTTIYTYDALGRQVLVNEPDPDGTGPALAPFTSYQYDNFGDMVARTTNDGRTLYEFDVLGRLIKETHLSGAPVNFNDVTINGYAGGQDTPGGAEILDNGAALKITGNHWKKINFPYEVTPNTVIEFDFRSTVEGEVQGIGFDDDNSLSHDNIFKLYGSQSWGRSEYDNYSATAPGIKHYKIPVGEFYTGEFLYLVFGSDDDVNDAAVSLFSNIKIYEASTTTYAYNANGDRLSETDANGNSTSYEYDNLGRLIKKTDAEGGETAYTYDANGNRLTLTDPVQNTTTWTYDYLNRVVSETNELNHTRSFEYDAASNLTQRTDRSGRVTQYEYDGLQRRTAEKWLDSSQTVIRTLSYGYDAASQLITATDPAATYTFTYDNLGRNTRTVHDLAALGFDVVIDEAYDTLGRRISLAAEIDGTADLINQYSYDYLGRMTQVTQSGQTGGNAVAEKRVDFAYDAFGRQFASITRYADLAGSELVATSSYGYDAADRLTSLTHADGGSSTLAGYTWAFDEANRLTGFTVYGHPDEDATYSYDDTDQLTGADRDGTTDDESYSYDENGNRTNSGYSTGDNNQLLTDGTYNYSYDEEGNRLTKTNISTGEVVEYAWDHRNRLTSIVTDKLGVVTHSVDYAYDIFGRRIGKVIDADGAGSGTATEVNYIYDGLREERGNAGDHILLAFDENDDLTERMLYGPNVDQILAQEDVDSLIVDGEILWALTDHLGSVRDIVTYDVIADTATVENHVVYDAFGQITAESDPSIRLLIGFTGREIDTESDLQYHRARYLAVATGVWINEDPIGFDAGDANLFRYVANNPVAWVDPSGNAPPAALAAVLADGWAYWATALAIKDTASIVLSQGPGTSMLAGLSKDFHISYEGLDLDNAIRTNIFNHPLWESPGIAADPWISNFVLRAKLEVFDTSVPFVGGLYSPIGSEQSSLSLPYLLLRDGKFVFSHQPNTPTRVSGLAAKLNVTAGCSAFGVWADIKMPNGGVARVDGVWSVRYSLRLSLYMDYTYNTAIPYSFWMNPDKYNDPMMDKFLNYKTYERRIEDVRIYSDTFSYAIDIDPY